MMSVAFIITVYMNDKLEFFSRAVESILNQDCTNKKIKIYLGIDGKLPSDIYDYISKNRASFHKIIINDENCGLAYTLNRIIDSLEDERYIFRMDSDDICKPDRVTKQVSFLEEKPNLEIVGGAIEEIDDSENVKMIRTYPKSTADAKYFIAKASVFAHPAVCFRKSFFEKGFRYDIRHQFNQDLALWFEALYNNVEVGNIDNVVLSFRVSSDFYKRRSYGKALGEFSVFWNGIKSLHGYNWRLLYPIIRIITRLMPISIVKILYSKNIRSSLNK